MSSTAGRSSVGNGHQSPPRSRRLPAPVIPVAPTPPKLPTSGKPLILSLLRRILVLVFALGTAGSFSADLVSVLGEFFDEVGGGGLPGVFAARDGEDLHASRPGGGWRRAGMVSLVRLIRVFRVRRGAR